MAHDTEALVATLQLLLGDHNREDLMAILNKAFWPKVRVFGAAGIGNIRSELGQIETAATHVENHACEQVRQTMEEIRSHRRHIESVLTNPER